MGLKLRKTELKLIQPGCADQKTTWELIFRLYNEYWAIASSLRKPIYPLILLGTIAPAPHCADRCTTSSPSRAAPRVYLYPQGQITDVNNDLGE